jgi:hypothetical protein
MHFEVELKFRCGDLAAVRNGLIALGAAAGDVVEQVDQYYRHPVRDFARTDEAFRLRRVGPRNFMTYKGPKVDATTKTRYEQEFALADGPAAFQSADDMLQGRSSNSKRRSTSTMSTTRRWPKPGRPSVTWRQSSNFTTPNGGAISSSCWSARPAWLNRPGRGPGPGCLLATRDSRRVANSPRGWPFRSLSAPRCDDAAKFQPACNGKRRCRIARPFAGHNPPSLSRPRAGATEMACFVECRICFLAFLPQACNSTPPPRDCRPQRRRAAAQHQGLSQRGRDSLLCETDRRRWNVWRDATWENV